jgi:predicted alpha/beta-fold hydrolase
MYKAPAWLPDGHSQTIAPALWSKRHFGRDVTLHRERWLTPDGDFVDVDRSTRTQGPQRPLLVLFHGLEGSSSSHYAKAFARQAHGQGWDFAIPHFRGCSGELNLAPRAYHSGDHAEIDWMLRRFHAESPARPLLAAGVSLGGNALVRWAGERGASAQRVLKAAAAICAPLDLAAAGHAMGRGFNRAVYTRMFLQTMVPKALAKLAQHPGLFDARDLRAARDLYAFDNVFTAPLHGYRNTEDYWARASAKPWLKDLAVPVLLLNAGNDPFVPARSLPGRSDVASCVTLWQPADGGHVGFPSALSARPWTLNVDAMPRAVIGWMAAHLN